MITFQLVMFRHALAILCVLGSSHAFGAGPAAAIDPISGILDAFKSYRVVALGEGNHGNEQGHAFRVAGRDPTAAYKAECAAALKR